MYEMGREQNDYGTWYLLLKILLLPGVFSGCQNAIVARFICGMEDAVCRRNITVAIRRNYLLALKSAVINCLHEYAV